MPRFNPNVSYQIRREGGRYIVINNNVKKKLTDKQYKDIVELLQKQHKNLEKKPYYLTAVAPVIRVRKDDGGCCGYSLRCELQSFKFVAHLSDEGLKKLKEQK